MPVLARYLKDRGIVTERQLQEGIRHQVLYGGRLGTNLYELGYITEERLQEALSKTRGVPSLAVDLREIQPENVQLVPKAMAAKHKIFPYRLRGKTLFLLMLDPGDHEAVAKVGYSLGYIVRPAVVPEFRMIQLLRDYYGIDERWRFTDTRRPRVMPPAPSDPRAAADRIDEAASRDEVVQALLVMTRGFFRRVLFFIVREPWVLGWAGTGEGVDRELAESLRIPLDQPSVFQRVAHDRAFFIGRLGPEPENQRFVKAVRKKPGTNAALIPITLKGRVVNLLYGDNGTGGNVRGELGELLVLLQRVPRAYMRIIRRRVAETRKDTEASPPEDTSREDEE